MNQSNDPFFPDGLPRLAGPPQGSDLPWQPLPAAAVPADARRRPPAAAPVPDPAALLRALRHRWLLALTLGSLAALVTAAAAWRLMPPTRYTATALLEVKAQKPVLLAPDGQDRPDFRVFQSTQIALVQSSLVLSAALARPGVADLPTVRAEADPADWLERRLVAEFLAGSELMELGLTGDRPADLAVILNAVAEAYLEEIVVKDRADRSASSGRLKTLLGEYNEKLTRRRAELKKLAETVGSDDRQTLALKQQFAVQQLAQEKAELQKVDSERKRSQAELEVVRAALDGPSHGPGPLDPSVVAEAMARDPVIGRLREQAEALDVKLRRVRRVSRKGADPALRDLLVRQAALGEAVAARRAELLPRVEKELRAQLGGPDEERAAELETQIKILGRYEDILHESVARLEREAQSFNRQTIDLQWMKDEVAQWEETARQLGKQYEALNVELKAPQRGRLVQRADRPRPESRLKRLALVGMAVLAAFGTGVLGVSWREYRFRRVESPDEVAEGLGLRLVGTLPALPEPGRGGPPARRGDPPEAARWQNLLIESVDAARALLLRDCRADDLRSVMIASAAKGEGKSSLASHLAISVARTGCRTLLVDLDLRKPSLHALFDLEPGPGVSELLRGEAGIDDVACPVTADLDVVPAGASDGRAVRALGQAALPDLLARLKVRYDFVVIDSAPLLPVADSLLIGQHADAVLLSVFRDVSRLPAVFAGFERLNAMGARVLGVVVTGMAASHYGQAYHYAPVRR